MTDRRVVVVDDSPSSAAVARELEHIQGIKVETVPIVGRTPTPEPPILLEKPLRERIRDIQREPLNPRRYYRMSDNRHVLKARAVAALLRSGESWDKTMAPLRMDERRDVLAEVLKQRLQRASGGGR